MGKGIFPRLVFERDRLFQKKNKKKNAFPSNAINKKSGITVIATEPKKSGNAFHLFDAGNDCIMKWKMPYTVTAICEDKDLLVVSCRH